MFNKNSRIQNSYRTSLAGVTGQILNIVSAFLFRTVFLFFLGAEYLGINGLFSNILQLLSLADLGITTIISFRLYQPIADGDVEKVAAYMTFYKHIYRMVAAVIVGLGLLLMPFLSFFVDLGEVPNDINPYLVFGLFILQSASSYLFSYRQVLINADQRGYLTSIFFALTNVAVNVFKILFLALTHDYTLVLVVGIVVQVLLNAGYYIYITKQYPEVFRLQARVTKEERRSVFSDARAGLCHRIGGMFVSGTDNIILSKFVSLASVGIYSNYSLLTSSVSTLVSSTFSNLSPSVGDFETRATPKESERLYLRMFFGNLWIVCFCTICLYTLLNPFIAVWQDESYLLSKGVVLVLCIQFFMQSTNIVNGIFINATGLFNRDKIRPLIEAVLNLAISIVGVQMWGIIGVFVGTVVSGLLTYYWRNYYLLYRHVFRTHPTKIILTLLFWCALSVGIVFLLQYLFRFTTDNWGGFFLKTVMAASIPNLIFLLLLFPTDDFAYYKSKVFGVLFRRLKK